LLESLEVVRALEHAFRACLDARELLGDLRRRFACILLRCEKPPIEALEPAVHLRVQIPKAAIDLRVQLAQPAVELICDATQCARQLATERTRQ
jgi:hypothetical protein